MATFNRLIFDTSKFVFTNKPTRIDISLRRINSTDSFVQVPDSQQSVVINEQATIYTIPVVASSDDSLYEINIYSKQGQMFRAFFAMPDDDVFLHDLELWTAYPSKQAVIRKRFLDLEDTPDTFTDHEDKYMTVKDGRIVFTDVLDSSTLLYDGEELPVKIAQIVDEAAQSKVAIGDFAFNGDLDPAPAWVPVPQATPVTPALQGSTGPMNVQARALTARQNFLRQQTDSLGSTKADATATLQMFGLKANSADVFNKTELTAIKQLQDANIAAGGDGSGLLDNLLLSTNNKTQKFINEQWLDFTPYASSNAATNTANLRLLATAAKALNKGIRCAPCGTVAFDDNLDLTGLKYIDFRTDITLAVGKTITAGGFANTAPASDILFYSITDGTSFITGSPPATPLLRLVGFKNARITIGNCNYVQLYAQGSIPALNSTAYNDITLLGVVKKLEITDDGSVDSKGKGGWVNENKIWGGRIIRCNITGVSYTHNHNKWYHNTFEGGENSPVILEFVRAASNYFFGMRLEDNVGIPTVNFDANSSNNKLIQSWSDSGSPRAELNFGANVTDLGEFNHCTTDAAILANKTELFNVQGNMLVSDGVTAASQFSAFGRPKGTLTNLANFTPNLAQIGLTNNRMIALTALVPVQRGDVVKFDCDYDGSILRGIVYCYDANQKLITDVTAGALIKATSDWTFSGERYGSGALPASALNIGFSVARSDVSFIQVGCYTSSAGTARSISAYLYTQNLLRGKSAAGATQRIKLPQLAGDVTKGYVPVGYQVYNSTFKVRNHVNFAFETRLTAAVASAATTITIDSATGIKNGDIVGIQLDDGTTHWTKVSALSGTTHTVDALPSAAALGNRVVYNRWAVINYSATLASATYAQGTTTLVYTIAGATIGQKVTVGHNKSLGALIVKGDVTAADTVTVYIYNPTATGIAVAGGSIYISVE